jgi:hypothetical protein
MQIDALVKAGEIDEARAEQLRIALRQVLLETRKASADSPGDASSTMSA